jgi:hypothetical protein
MAELWIGEARMLDRLQSELDLLNDIQICKRGTTLC